MIARYFDRSKDKAEDVARLNPFPPQVQEWLAAHYSHVEFPEQNLVVLEHEGELVGVLHLFDGGFPWAIIDGFFIKEGHRSLTNALLLGRFAEEELKKRGIPLYITYAEPRLAKGLEYCGLKLVPGVDFKVLVGNLFKE